MSTEKQFQSIVENLTEQDFATMRRFILETVVSEYGPLIHDLQEMTTQVKMPEDPFVEQAEPADPFVTQAPKSLVDLMRALGLIDDAPKGRVGVIHVEFR